MKRIRGIRGRVQQGVLEIRRWINRAAIAKVKRSARFGRSDHEPPFSIRDAVTEDFRSIDREKWSHFHEMFFLPSTRILSSNELLSIVLPGGRLVVNHHYSRPTDTCSKNMFLQRFLSKNVL